MIKIPVLTFEEVDTETFRQECLKVFLPKRAAEYAIGDVVMITCVFNRKLPGTVIGVSVGSSVSDWRYDLARPRLSDGVLERVQAAGDQLTLIERASRLGETRPTHWMELPDAPEVVEVIK